MATFTEEEANEALKKGAEKVSKADLEGLLKRSEEIENRFASSGPLAKFVADLKILLSLLQDYWNGTYKAVPWGTIASIVAALAYVLNPLDLIPDFVPILGFVDDAAVVGLCLAFIRSDFNTYAAWKKANA